MTGPRAVDDWTVANQAQLSAALDEVRQLLRQHAAAGGGENPPGPSPGATVDRAPTDEQAVRPPTADVDEAPGAGASALDALARTFGLSRFERLVLLLCAGMELDSSFAGLCADASGDARLAYPTFSLALAAFPEAHWSAITPSAPLRAWRMVELGRGDIAVSSPLRIDERILHHLTGIVYLDERLRALVRPVQPPALLVPSHWTVAQRLAAVWGQETVTPRLPVCQLVGPEVEGARAVAAAAASTLGVRLFVIDAGNIPTGADERDALARLWDREAALTGCVLLIDCRNLAGEGGTAAASALLRRIEGAVAVSAREPVPTPGRVTVRLQVDRPPPDEQRAVWTEILGDRAAQLNGDVERVVGHFRLGLEGIDSVRTHLTAGLSGDEHDVARALWDACRIQSRPRLDDLAQRIEVMADWDQLVLPEPQRRILREIAANVGQRARVYEHWGMGRAGSRGLGISAVFAGASGTGKTMAAEVLGGELELDLYRIDLSQVVSKYIGETEKNLARVFEAAEEGGAILLFDEADALFGKRSEVKDSHDRYANLEISYLLQRMEAYRGLAILTTNMKSALDSAFLRRIRFIVQFPFPDARLRAEIWRRTFPADTPTEALDVERLARLNVAGGNIRNIALGAAFLAASEDQPVGMKHLLRAARTEYAKLEKPLTEVEIGGWT